MANTQKLEIETLADPAALGQHAQAWQELADDSVEHNVFYEPWMLIPALELLGEGDGVSVLFLKEAEKLVAVVPLQKIARYRGIPLPHAQLWIHRHCYLSTPLIRRGYEGAALEALLKYLLRFTPGKLLEWNWASSDGPIFAELERLARERGWVLVKTEYERACLRGRRDGEEYLAAAVSGKHRRDLQRLEKRLVEEGELIYRQARNETEATRWLEIFFELEASGWKGNAGTAMRASPGDRDFMSRIVRDGFAQGRAVLSVSELDGEPVACKVDFVSGKGAGTSFSFKIGFNDKYSRSRPGLLLELWLLKNLAQARAEFFDSCSQPGSMFDRLWMERRRIASISLALRTAPEGWIVRLYPHIKRWGLKLRELRHRPNQKGARAALRAPEGGSELSE